MYLEASQARIAERRLYTLHYLHLHKSIIGFLNFSLKVVFRELPDLIIQNTSRVQYAGVIISAFFVLCTTRVCSFDRHATSEFREVSADVQKSWLERNKSPHFS